MFTRVLGRGPLARVPHKVYHQDSVLVNGGTQVPSIEEGILVEGLQPIRHFALANALFHFLESGVQEALEESGDADIKEFADTLELDENRLCGLLAYLQKEGFVALTDYCHVNLTPSGRQLAVFRPWYQLIVGGYAESFRDLGRVLKDPTVYAPRDTFYVARGSAGISEHDALPMTRRLIKEAGRDPLTLVDIGCSTGSFLLALCRALPSLHGIGIDPDPRSIQLAQEGAADRQLSTRVLFHVGDDRSVASVLSEKGSQVCFLAAFVLQEILEQRGQEGLLALLRNQTQTFPKALWIIIEVDHRPQDAALFASGLGLAYYNPYYLIHEITQQRLESHEFWIELFEEASLALLTKVHPEHSYDSLDLKVGYLLATKSVIE